MTLPTTPQRDAPKAWGDDVPLRGPNAPKNDGKIKHLIEYLLTVYERFGNTVVTNDLQWGAAALHKLHEERERIEALEAELAALRDTRSETQRRNDVIEEIAKSIEAAPLTYAGPDPHVASDLRYLIVCAIRDMKAPLLEVQK